MTKLLQGVVAALALALAASAMAAAEPSLQDVNTAVRAGHLQEAQSMMLTVLSNHPDSAKAHFVESEVLERLARRDEAQRELARAEQIDPSLHGIPLDTVENLKARLAVPVSHAVVANPPAPSFPWGPVLLIGGSVLLVILVLRARRPTVIVPAGGAVGGPYGAGGYGPGYGSPGYGPAPMGGGMGSGILGGLATGAAVGAGMVAGEALANEFMGHHDASRNVASNGWDNASSTDTSDLGVSGGWDSGGGSDLASGDGGGGDWS